MLPFRNMLIFSLVLIVCSQLLSTVNVRIFAYKLRTKINLTLILFFRPKHPIVQLDLYNAAGTVVRRKQCAVEMQNMRNITVVHRTQSAAKTRAVLKENIVTSILINILHHAFH